MTPATYRPRDMRAHYLTAMAVTVKDSIFTFDPQIGEASAINAFKMRVDQVMKLGPSHPGVRARYKGRAAMLNHVPLSSAIRLVDHWYRKERREREWGMGSPLSHLVLGELRLILRWMSADGRACQFQSFIDDVLS